jgi:ferric-dicitrate binding protein FerR (iron transport regulator)
MNNSGKLMHIMLPDSSLVILSPGALVNYNDPFANDKRDVALEGEARFNVVKNKEKPFTVYAGGLATTALGTEFTINTMDAEKHHVSVKLHTGRVLITATGNLVAHWKKDIYLIPGQQLKFDITKMITSIGLIKNNIQKTRLPLADKKIKAEINDGLTFENTPLPEVLTRLSAYYHENIYFDSSYLQEMNFTGTISKSDLLPIVLKVITQMNNLELIHDNGNYEIKKPED